MADLRSSSPTRVDTIGTTNEGKHLYHESDVVIPPGSSSRVHNIPRDENDPPVYSADPATDDIQSIIQKLSSDPDCASSLPILAHTRHGKDSLRQMKTAKLQNIIVSHYFETIANKGDEAVSMLISNNIVTANTTNFIGETPLLAAVRVGNVRMVQELMDFGAQVDAFGTVMTEENIKLVQVFASRSMPMHREVPASQRTPLQSAAERGNLNLVKLFVDVYHADDALIAPDGQLALRLAAENGHKDIVDFLPVRRGGGWRRWRVQHDEAVNRARRAVGNVAWFFKLLLWKTPKFFLWDIPKSAWKERKWLLRQLLKATKAIARAYRKIPEFVVDFCKEVWKGALRMIKGIPGAVKIIGQWIWNGAKSVAHATFNIAKRAVSLIHTTFASIITFFKNVTLKDIINALSDTFDAIFIELPKTVWKLIVAFREASWRVLERLFGILGYILGCVAEGVFRCLLYIPVKTWEFLAASGGTAMKEILVWINPKGGKASFSG